MKIPNPKQTRILQNTDHLDAFLVRNVLFLLKALICSHFFCAFCFKQVYFELLMKLNMMNLLQNKLDNIDRLIFKLVFPLPVGKVLGEGLSNYC